MAPTIAEINTTAMQPLIAEQITTEEALTRAESPVKKFMAAHTSVADLGLFVTMAQAAPPETVEAAPLQALGHELAHRLAAHVRHLVLHRGLALPHQSDQGEHADQHDPHADQELRLQPEAQVHSTSARIRFTPPPM